MGQDFGLWRLLFQDTDTLKILSLGLMGTSHSGAQGGWDQSSKRLNMTEIKLTVNKKD